MCPTALDPAGKLNPIKYDNDDLACDEVLDDENGNKVDVVSEPKQKLGAVSIDVTKALLLLGFASWSGLEEGIATLQILMNNKYYPF